MKCCSAGDSRHLGEAKRWIYLYSICKERNITDMKLKFYGMTTCRITKLGVSVLNSALLNRVIILSDYCETKLVIG